MAHYFMDQLTQVWKMNSNSALEMFKVRKET